MIILGLTGSIGTGKSTTAGMFRELGVPVHDSDATVHALYGGEAVGPVGEAFPAVVSDGVVDRKALAAELAARPDGFSRLEAIIHPLVRLKEAEFLLKQRTAGALLVVLDIPLLFETGADERVDKVLVVTCEPETQRRRVLARPGMTEEKFAMLMARQMPDVQKRQRADFVVKTDNGLEDARKQVKLIVDILKGESGAHA
ncbi:dephospho-CoA kinase [Rhizobium sp. GN54]|uniref:dephospho-CoA kinase n=1 Tax=Rhizobium sp. GN54 TaxID=2898150 RepID=UPI001E28D9B0|nr:dephospho-CoA kinase [Rhizobium sp. GN54]MCD2182726.1 dephospho-CoA kinase [Rhizobium sp. GN54]